ncbi:FliC/FljB family flagellin [Providencia huaxiensis]|nr:MULTISPECIES: FliC/FljB family flagellin [Providencia]ELR5057889.1 FliC/FljB family flagellin [Providencia rettgeri]ELR5085348.1 FliC/FljB family flagellin [Providencia rettgeri]ELR5108499.1 FliC/FljB family flagellin [Providencia rettgeri]ELR5284694.1 FliC/FljB family flagellin [Providencia rettgeri]ELY3856822.1 FliC/FljB family flagellin [Providencia rettgeri]
MAQVINTNILSLTTQNNLNRSQGVLGSAIERLSSGSRINSAKDDAAGQAIANRFTANVKGLTQASRNANDAISIAQTAEGAVNEINENIQRIRELTVQAKNDTNSSSDRTSIQDEVQARLDEIKRISDQTQFNGINVLSQETTMNFQVGANDSDVIDFKMEKINVESLNLTNFDLKGPIEVKAAVEADLKKQFTLPKTQVSETEFTGIDVAEVVTDAKTGKLYTKVGDDYFEVKAEAKLDDATGDKTEVTLTKGDAVSTGTVIGDADEVAKYQESKLKQLDDALTQVDSYRSKLGAFQNRMQSTINNLNNSVNNLSAARSRIQDADFATEVSNMSRGQILQQAGTAVLAQANQVPQGVLSLLR